jgi:hypothetical protein
MRLLSICALFARRNVGVPGKPTPEEALEKVISGAEY